MVSSRYAAKSCIYTKRKTSQSHLRSTLHHLRRTRPFSARFVIFVFCPEGMLQLGICGMHHHLLALSLLCMVRYFPDVFQKNCYLIVSSVGMVGNCPTLVQSMCFGQISPTVSCRYPTCRESIPLVWFLVLFVLHKATSVTTESKFLELIGPHSNTGERVFLLAVHLQCRWTWLFFSSVYMRFFVVHRNC